MPLILMTCDTVMMTEDDMRVVFVPGEKAPSAYFEVPVADDAMMGADECEAPEDCGPVILALPSDTPHDTFVPGRLYRLSFEEVVASDLLGAEWDDLNISEAEAQRIAATALNQGRALRGRS